MKFEHYLEKLHESDEFKEFKQKNPKAYLAAGFFIIDLETDKNLHQIDYALPNKKIATFFIDRGIKLKISGQAIKKKLPEIKVKTKTDLEALKGIVEDEMKNRTVTEKIRKIIAILHIMDNKLIWNLQCILSGLEILLIHIDDSDQSILKFEKHSLMELIRAVPSLETTQPVEEKRKKIRAEDLKKIQNMIKSLKENSKESEGKVKKKGKNKRKG